MSGGGDHPVVRARWVIIAVFAAVCAWFVPGVAHLRHDDDVLAFLPPDDPDVVAFREVADRFGMLEVALVGLEAPDGDMLAPARVDEVRTLAKRVEEVDGVKMVLSFVDLPHPRVTEEGLEVMALVPEEMRDAEAIRARVLGSTDAVGNLISADGSAAALLVYLTFDRASRSEQRATALAGVRERVLAGWDGRALFGGAPFMEHTAAESSRTDIERLSPIVIAVLVAASAALLGSVTAAGLNLVIAGLGVGLVLGGHGRFDEPLSIVSSTVPVMMVALGGAFGVHMLAGYQRQSGTSRERASRALHELWAPVALSGVTTSVAFFALLVMPQEPMQRFGIAAGCGVLLLMFLALGVLPALLSVLPGSLIRPRPERRLPLRARPPAWLLVLITLGGAWLGSRLEADPDTVNVFDPDSEPRRANAFFDEHFGGSVYLQIAVEADLGEPVVLRRIRDIARAIRDVDGVADVRTLVEPVALLNEALGGRRGVPETPARARRVLTYLADHPAMAQLMTPERDGALVHVKLAPSSGERQVEITRRVQQILAAQTPSTGIRVGATTDDAIAGVRVEQIRLRVAHLLGRAIEPGAFAEALAGGTPSAALVAEARKLRDRALDSDDSPVEGVPRGEIDAIAPATLLEPRGEALAGLLRTHLPTLVQNDPEGIGYVAEHLGAWLDEAVAEARVGMRCEALGAGEGEGGCERIQGALSELDDAEWSVPAEVDAEIARTVPWRSTLTGQPVVGQAFARSVTRSLYHSTFVSLCALAVMLALSRQLHALVPATWTVLVTAGVIAVLGHPISIGTSMVSCIALGAGVDFAIHLGVRARRLGGAGDRAVDEIGAVMLISATQLALAFAVLVASRMPPLRQFGVGLAIGLIGAALGAVWLVPLLVRRRSGR